MNRSVRVNLASVCVAVSLAASPVVAAEPFLDFLHGLQERGYGEQALAYLDSIEKRPDLPAELRETLVLERSRSLRIAAPEGYSAEIRQTRLDDAKKLLDEFTKANPNHPAASQSLITWGNDLLLKGQMSLGAARGAREKEVQEKSRAEARTTLAEAHKQFEGAVAQLKTQLDKMPVSKIKKKNDPRVEVEIAWLEGRFNLGLSDYMLADTYVDPAAPERKALLEKAAKQFDSIFQEYRGERVGFLGHMWHGKTLEELGDAVTAMDIYDEVLVVSPEGGDATPDQAPLFGQAELFRLRLLGKKAPEDVIDEGDEWMKSHRKWINQPVYQGVALETAKARLTVAEKAKPADQKKMYREAMSGLANIGKYETEYRNEALLLRRELAPKLGGPGDGELSYEECIALADDSMNEKDWKSATDYLDKAVEQAKTAKDDKKVEIAFNKLADVRYRVAVDAYAAGKLEEALKLAGAIVRDSLQSEAAKGASGLAIACSLQLYQAAAAERKDDALERLQKIADFTAKTWPDSPEADDARMALARANLLKNDDVAALKLLDDVNPLSKRYGAASQIAGQVRWKNYLEGKKLRGGPDAQPEEELTKFRDGAIATLKKSLEHQKGTWNASSEPMPSMMFDTQVLLAQIHFLGDEATEATALYEPLVEQIKAQKPTGIDVATQKVFVGAVRSQLAVGATEKAGETALALMSFGADDPQINSVLVDFSKLMGAEAKRVEGEITDAETAGDLTKVDALKTKLTNAQAVSGQFLQKLSERQQYTVPQLLYMGDACALVNQNDKAREFYQRMLAAVENDESAKATAGPAVTRVRSRLLGLLRQEGKFDEALKQVEALIKDHPNALEPLMEKGRILQVMAERDPTKFDACVQHWTEVRMKLGSSRNKPPEYFEVLYYAAQGLVKIAQRNKGGEEAKQAVQMLKSTLITTPKLSGPDMVAKYNALAAQAAKLQAANKKVTGGK